MLSSTPQHLVSRTHKSGSSPSKASTNGHYGPTSGSRGMDTLERRIAPGAFHNSGEKFDAPKCNPRTQNAVLNAILEWGDDLTKETAMLWIYGPPGSGKSAIAQNIAQICYEKGQLAASFFFSKSIPGRNNEKHLMATLAYQIALSIPETRRYIAAAVESDPSVFSGTLESQLQALIVNPLAQAYESVSDRANRHWARLIVIDGLDHCHGPNIQRYIVRILSTAVIHRKLPILILVSSRPEPPIRDSFNSYDLREFIKTLVLDENYLPDTDLKRYFWSRFEQIKQTHPLRTYIPSSWPSSSTINALVQKSSGQYIYASTVVRYVDSLQHRPVERLEAVLRIQNPSGEIPFAELDCLYRHIFSAVHNLKTVLRVLGALLFAQRLLSKRATGSGLIASEVLIPVTDPRFLEELLSLNRGDVYFLLGDLHSIISVPDPRRNTAPTSSNGKANETGIKILQPALVDFLTDRSRAGKYFINSVKVHAELARSCAKNLLSGHKFVHQYAGQAFVTHCRHSVLTNELLNDLLGFDLSIWLTTCKTWSEGGGPFEQAWIELPNLFSWLKGQTYPDPQKDLHERHMVAWEQYLHSELKTYLLDEILSDLLAFTTYPNLLWDWIHVWPLLGVPYSESVEKEEMDRKGLHLTGLKQQFDPYRHMLSQFLTDKVKAGRFAITPERYARVALKVATYLFETKKPGKLYEYQLPSEWTWYRQDYDDKIFREKKTKETFQAGLQYLPFFLAHASPNDEKLIQYLKSHKLDRIRAEELPREAWAVDKAAVEKGVEAYLERSAKHSSPMHEDQPSPARLPESPLR